jgi:uncharacterized protein YndB with AHSA1/START domain
MTIAPILLSVDVKAPPERAFDLFTGHIGKWWPVGRTVAKTPHADVVIEPRAGGRWFEVDADGVETPWGKVVSWEPPHRVVLGWQLNSQWTFDPDLVTEVELSFTAQDGGARVTLEHRNLERFGADADKLAGQLGGGWPTFMNIFADYASEHST